MRLSQTRKRKKRGVFFQKEKRNASRFDFFSVLRHAQRDFFIENMVRRRRSRRSSGSPLVSWIILLAIVFGAGLGLWKIFHRTEGVSEQTTIILEQGAQAEIKMEDATNFLALPTVTELWENETIRSDNGGITLEFFTGSRVYLDKNTTVQLEKVRSDEKENMSTIHIALKNGRLWANVVEERNPKSTFRISTPHFLVNTKSGSFSVDEYSIVVTKGMATVSAGDTYSKDVDVGQELVFSEADLRNIIVGGMGPQKEAISDIFRMSDWFAKNTNTKEQENIQDKNDTSIVQGEVLTEEIENSPIHILTPGKNGSVVTVTDLPVRITGTVPAETEKVMVNGFRLSQFNSGDTEFLYLADPKWNTLHDGKNEYTIVAIQADGTRYETKITLLYNTVDTKEKEEKQKTTLSEGATIEPKDTPAQETEQVSGTLSILSPKNGAVITKSETIISGTAPTNAAKIVVNGYTLGKFKKGNTSWTYIIADRLGNRPTGEYTVNVQAFDTNQKEIGTASITLTIKPTQKQSSQGEQVEMREGTLPPVESDDIHNPTI